MPTPLKRRLRLARRGTWYVLAVLLVCMALVLGVASQVLPLAERHPDRIAAWLSERAGRPVAFDSVDTQWTRRGPLLRLDGLRVGEGANAIRIGEAEVLVSMYAGLLPGRSFTELRLRGLSLTLQRADDGTLVGAGLAGTAGRQRSAGDSGRPGRVAGHRRQAGGGCAFAGLGTCNCRKSTCACGSMAIACVPVRAHGHALTAHR